MNSEKAERAPMDRFGKDLHKWYIVRYDSGHSKRWHVCPPVTGEPGWSGRGASFDTGAEALAAFAKGDQNV